MPPYTNLRKSFVEAGASESEDDLLATATIPTHRSANTKHSTSKTMPRATTAPKRKAAPAKKRPALKDRTNLQDDKDTFDDADEDDAAKPKPKRAKTAASTTKSRAAPTKAKTARRAPVEPIDVIPETQQDPADVSQSIELVDDMDITTVPTPPQVGRYVQRARSASVQPVQPLVVPRPSARAGSVQPGYPPPRERSGSATAAERRGDPELRRQLNEMTLRYESLHWKYQNIEEVGESAAQANFDKLKRASDQKSKDADALISSLKKELAEARKMAAHDSNNSADNKEIETLQQQKSSLTANNGALTTENGNLKSSLQVAQNEVKSLEAKLVAARQQLSSMTSAQDSKSAADVNTRNNASRSVAANATDAQKEAKMKENLYSDLTGLIIRGVKRKDGEDEYDCIQTGRNGTLHFHLSIANDSSVHNPRTPSGLSYEDAEFAYEPLLDEGRDRDLIDILPDYLTEEICFPRNHAVKFYARVVDSMTKKIVVEE